MSKEVVYLFWTCREKGEAEKIIRALLEERLIACASLFPEVESMYRWEGKLEQSQEVKVILKTVSRHFQAIRDYILAHCSYEVPEIVQLNVSDGNPLYLSWVVQETTRLL